MQHTKGPWRYNKTPYGDYTEFKIQTVDMSHSHTFIGEVGGGLQSDAEIEANAKLISAAPELLEALQGLVELGKRPASQTDSKDYHAYLKAKEVIKKAIEQ